MTGLVVVLAYALGAGIGVASSRSVRLADVWRVIIRWQIVIVSVGVSILAAWRLEGIADLAWPFIAAFNFETFKSDYIVRTICFSCSRC